MKIAVTYEEGKVFQHFGHTEHFKFYEVEDGKVTTSQVVDTNGSGHGALAGLLAEHQVDVLICGGIGGGAQAALAEVGIKLYGGVTGEADQAAYCRTHNRCYCCYTRYIFVNCLHRIFCCIKNTGGKNR